MRNTRFVRGMSACTLAIALTGVASSGLANEKQQRGYAGGGMYGPGMMQGYGPGGCEPGMMPGYGPGGGYGPGMMQGYGPGGGYGPGMMHGQGYGPGMMQGSGQGAYGPGMMQGQGRTGANLSEKQQKRLQNIHQESYEKNWKLMEQMQKEQQNLYRLNQAPKADYDAIEKATKALGELRQQMAEEQIQTRKRIQQALSEDE